MSLSTATLPCVHQPSDGRRPGDRSFDSGKTLERYSAERKRQDQQNLSSSDVKLQDSAVSGLSFRVCLSVP